ncbi:MAG: hypothetical protein KA715_09245 [Xanthomonadaceae bacterium]|nr:hypothetical protein [Xanthomonadaceae bacterium]
MTQSTENTFYKRLRRYGAVFIAQARVNREYIYFWILATALDVILFEALHPMSIGMIVLANLLVGFIAIGSVVRPIDKAFETIGLDYSKGYGEPTWIVRGKYPLKNDRIRIRAAGYDASDFEKHILQLSSRLSQPIKSISKPSATVPEIEVVLKRTNIPDSVAFHELDLNSLSQGEFFIGHGDEVVEKLSLTKMIHMLVAGQTGSGKTQFIKQFMTTVLTQTRGSYLCLIDMKGGIDFQSFRKAPNFSMVTSYSDAELLLDQCLELFEKRKEYLIQKSKTNWNEFLLKDLEQEKALQGFPVGPVVIVVDELAELSKKALEKSAKSGLQERIATLARLARFTGIHLVLGTQRPDKSTIDMQSKDNLPTRICFSVPSVSASTLVIGDMTASTLGSHPGRAVYQRSSNEIIQAPLIKNIQIEEMIKQHTEKLIQAGYSRSLVGVNQSFRPSKKVQLK